MQRVQGIISGVHNERRLAIVNGFHATRKSNVVDILRNGFKLSQNDEDWLGDGIYFWQDAPARAWEWARLPRQRHEDRIGSEAAVIGARIALPLDQTMDLLDITWTTDLKRTYWQLASQLLKHDYDSDTVERSLRQSSDFERAIARRADRVVINRLVQELIEEKKRRIVAVRAAFPEGRRVFPESGFWTHGHVQIAVREPEMIDPPETEMVCGCIFG